MTTFSIDFSQLSPAALPDVWQSLFNQLRQHARAVLDDGAWAETKRKAWRQIIIHNPDDDMRLSDWLIDLFAHLFSYHHTRLVRGADEPEYFAASDGMPARIVFAHGYFASALHEISHWCIAGQARRQLNDFGYWYAKDGRNAHEQAAFEQVEIKPQAIECLFTLACGRYFFVSQDNLNANFDTSASTFAHDVYVQAQYYLQQPDKLPKDAACLLVSLLSLCQADTGFKPPLRISYANPVHSP